jgi:hypothetical protein
VARCSLVRSLELLDRRRPNHFFGSMCAAAHDGLLHWALRVRVPLQGVIDPRKNGCHSGPDHGYEDRRHEDRRKDGSQTRQHERPVPMGQPVPAITDK